MIDKSKVYTGWAAVARLALGLALVLVSAWLASTNIFLSAFGLVAATDGSAHVVWEGIAPVLVGANSQASLGVGAGLVLGFLVSVVEALVWNGDIDWRNSSFMMRVTLISIILYDFASSVWGLTNGIFYDGRDPIQSAVRLAIAVALTVFAFSIGAERWLVMGWDLTFRNWREGLVALQLMPRKKGEHSKPTDEHSRTPGFPPDLPPHLRQKFLDDLRHKQKMNGRDRQRQLAEQQNSRKDFR